MQINVDKKTGSLLAIIAILIAVIVGLSIRDNSGNFVTNTHHGSMMDGGDEYSGSIFTGADVMFLQMMIPHHQQAIDISNLALKSSKDSELLALANEIITAQSAEIVQMKAWLKEAGADLDMGHSMSGMGGMLGQSELSALAAATGNSFDQLWLRGMIGHHDGAIHMTQMIEDASNLEIKNFGKAVVKDQSAQSTQMEAMLKRLS